MASTSETGHAKNVANFEDLIAYCTSFGAAYAPSRKALQLAQLTALWNTAQSAMTLDKAARRSFNKFTNDRMNIFGPLKQLATRAVNALDASEVTAETKKDARTIQKKVLGQRALGGKKELPQAAVAEDAAVPKQDKISVSQQSYDNVVDNFEKLVKLLETEPAYLPNEPELSVAGLQTLFAKLKAANTAVTTAQTDYYKTLISRNKILYTANTGLVDIALAAKKYVLSVFTAASPEYRKVRAIVFRNY